MTTTLSRLFKTQTRRYRFDLQKLCDRGPCGFDAFALSQQRRTVFEPHGEVYISVHLIFAEELFGWSEELYIAYASQNTLNSSGRAQKI